MIKLSKQNKNVLSKGVDEEKKKHKHGMSKWKEDKCKKNKTKRKWRILKKALSGERNSQKISTNRVPLFNGTVLGRAQHERYFWSHGRQPPKHFELRFHKIAVSLKAEHLKREN